MSPEERAAQVMQARGGIDFDPVRWPGAMERIAEDIAAAIRDAEAEAVAREQEALLIGIKALQDGRRALGASMGWWNATDQIVTLIRARITAPPA